MKSSEPGCTSSLMFCGDTSGTMIARKTWFFSASLEEERCAQVTVREGVLACARLDGLMVYLAAIESELLFWAA